MVSKSDRVLHHLSKRLLYRGQSRFDGGGGPIEEDVGTSEEVLTFVRKEGEEVKPEDTRCHAKKGNGRCKNEITFDMESGNWLVFCEEHAEQEEVARSEGGERVVRVGADSEADDEE